MADNSNVAFKRLSPAQMEYVLEHGTGKTLGEMLISLIPNFPEGRKAGNPAKADRNELRDYNQKKQRESRRKLADIRKAQKVRG